MNGQKTIVSDLRGIMPIMDCLNSEKDFLNGACVADKVIGKAAALLLVYGGVKSVYASVISDIARDYLLSQNIELFYDKSVEYIINRTHDGMCPMEKCCIDIDSPDLAYNVLFKKLNQMKKE